MNVPRSRTLIASILHQPAGNADDVPEHSLRKVLQHHLLLDLQLLVHTDGVQNEDGRHSFAVAGQQAAKLGLQQLFALFETCFLTGEEREGRFNSVVLNFARQPRCRSSNLEILLQTAPLAPVEKQFWLNIHHCYLKCFCSKHRHGQSDAASFLFSIKDFGDVAAFPLLRI